MRFNRRMRLEVPVQDVWAFFRDINTMARCLPGFDGARRHDERRSTVYVAQGAGPFKVSLPAMVEIVEEEPLRRLLIRIRGEDQGLGFDFDQELELRFLAPEPGETVVDLAAVTSVGGQLAALGDGLLQRKVGEMMAKLVEGFEEEVRAELTRLARRSARG